MTFAAAPRTFSDLNTAAFRFMKDVVDSVCLARIETDDTYGVSFNPGCPIRGRDAADYADWRLGSTVSEWSRRLDTGALGFDRRRLHEWKHHRPVYALVAQEGASTWHYHGVAFVPRRHVDAFERSAHQLWGIISPSGDMDMDPLRDGGWLGYITRKVQTGEPFTFQVIPEASKNPRA